MTDITALIQKLVNAGCDPVVAGAVVAEVLVTGVSTSIYRTNRPTQAAIGDGYYVYVIKSDQSTAVKIGISKNPWARVREMQAGTPHELTLIATFKKEQHLQSEKEIHEILSAYRKTGEWFELPANIMGLINEHSQSITYERLLGLLRSTVVTTPTTEATTVVTPSLSLKNLDSKEEKKEKRERGVRLPDDWHPSPTDLAFTAEKGMPEAVVPREVEKFRLHWHGKHGPTAVKTLDRGWPAAWKTWVIRACEWAGYSPGTGPPKPALPEAEIHRLEEWHRRKLEKSL